MHDDLRFLTGPIAPDATPVHVYTDGLMVLLYDESRDAELREQAPSILFGASRRTYDEAVTRDFLDTGRLLVYGLDEDNGAHADVLVGRSMTEAERAGGRWTSDDGWLDLPTGRLRIDTYDTLPMGDCDPDHEGAVVEVPAGRYRVRIHRKDWSAMREAGVDWFDRAEDAGLDLGDDGYIDDVIELLPLEEDAPAPSARNVLFGPCIGDEPEPVPPARGEVVDGVFHGRLIAFEGGDPAGITLDLGRAELEALGLAPGDRLVLQSGDATTEAHLHASAQTRGTYHRIFGAEGLRAMAGGTGVEACLQPVYIPTDGTRVYESRLHLSAHGTRPPLFGLPPGTPVTLRRRHGVETRVLQDARYEDGEVHAEVLACDDASFVLNADVATLRQLAPDGEQLLELEVGGTTEAVAFQCSPISKIVRRLWKRGRMPLVDHAIAHWQDPARDLVVLGISDNLLAPAGLARVLPPVSVGAKVVLRRA